MSSHTFQASRSGPGRTRRGLTLVEMLVSMAITLLMMAAVVNLFANISSSVRNRRASMEMSGQLRMARQRLTMDLAGVTCELDPKDEEKDAAADDGYFEIVEGQYSDKFPSGLIDGDLTNEELDFTTSLIPSSQTVDPTTANVTDGGGLGDYDDILALTVRSESEPFVGKVPIWDPSANAWVAETRESTLAEIVWYAVENPADGSLGEPGMRTVYRRVLLIAPWITLPPLNTFSGSSDVERFLDYYSQWDVSARLTETSQGSGVFKLVANTLGDLTKRENRYGHYIDTTLTKGFPHEITQSAIRQQSYDPLAPLPATDGVLRPFGSPFDAESERLGEDVMLNNVLAFDVRVFDSGAPLYETSAGVIVEPSDVGWDSVVGDPPVGYGAYVDLGWGGFDETDPIDNYVPPGSIEPQFEVQHQVGWRRGLDPSVLIGYPCIYDTWAFDYENDGVSQGGSAGTDGGTNDIDDEATYPGIQIDNDPDDPRYPAVLQTRNGTDDIGEKETAPPYNVPLKGIQVKLRIYEPDSRQIRESTVTHSF